MDKLSNFRKTLTELEQFLSTPVQDNRDQAGIIKAFEFTFEQSWKAIQKVAQEKGVEIGNPKMAFQFAMQNHWLPIAQESKWIQLLKDRNLTTHTYQEDLAKEVIERVQKEYIHMFSDLLQTLEGES